MREFTKGDQETLENHADWLEDQGGQNREIASMLRALLADRDELAEGDGDDAATRARKYAARADKAEAEVERLKADLSAGLGPEETVFITNENVALRSEVERLAHLATTEENRARDAEEKVERLEAERDEARSLVSSWPFGHLMRCAKVNGKQVCAEGCPQARIKELEAEIETLRST